MNLTFKEKKVKEGNLTNRQNTKWAKEIAANCQHDWIPLQFRMEVDEYMPDINNGRVYCVGGFIMEQFKKRLTSLINKHSLENESNTPDFILADYLVNCLKTFNTLQL